VDQVPVIHDMIMGAIGVGAAPQHGHLQGRAEINVQSIVIKPHPQPMTDQP